MESILPTSIYCKLLQVGKKTKEEVECWNDRKINSLVIKSQMSEIVTVCLVHDNRHDACYTNADQATHREFFSASFQFDCGVVCLRC